jgi:hypothetical protein
MRLPQLVLISPSACSRSTALTPPAGSSCDESFNAGSAGFFADSPTVPGRHRSMCNGTPLGASDRSLRASSAADTAVLRQAIPSS